MHVLLGSTNAETLHEATMSLDVSSGGLIIDLNFENTCKENINLMEFLDFSRSCFEKAAASWS